MSISLYTPSWKSQKILFGNHLYKKNRFRKISSANLIADIFNQKKKLFLFKKLGVLIRLFSMMSSQSMEVKDEHRGK